MSPCTRLVASNTHKLLHSLLRSTAGVHWASVHPEHGRVSSIFDAPCRRPLLRYLNRRLFPPRGSLHFRAALSETERMDDGGAGWEDWDTDFLEQVIRMEERALAAASQHPSPSQPSNPSFLFPSSHLPSQQPKPQTLSRQSRLYATPSSFNAVAPSPPQPISYSPPRELSQRPVDCRKPSSRQPLDGHSSAAPTPSSFVTSLTDAAKESENERLKRELERISKQLESREQECAELRDEVESKKEQLRSSSERRVCNDLKNISQYAQEVNNVNIQETSQDNRARRAVGVQTEKAAEATGLLQSDDKHAHQNLSIKLLSIWGPQSDQEVGESLVSKIFVIFDSLFMGTGADASSKIKLDTMADGTSNDIGRLRSTQSLSAFDASKLTTFYSVLVKVSDGMAGLEALLEPLVDLCGLDNVLIPYRALRVLHLIMKRVFSMERKTKPRDNIKIEGNLQGDDIPGIHGSESAKAEFPLIFDASIGFRSSASGYHLWNGQRGCEGILTSLSVRSRPLFELMHQIIKKKKEEAVRLEAVCIMNLILMRSNAFKEREKFGLQMVLESILELLKKGCGSNVQKQALHLLFLHLNCPQMLDEFCSKSKDGDRPCTVDMTLWGLASCLGSCGNAIEDLQLRRKAIMLLAFLSSSGTAGLEIVTNHQLPKGTNFLMLILQTLLSELDAEASASPGSPEILRERTYIMREGLILLNRLVSNPHYASTSLQLLTNNRDMVSLTLDVANRMSQKISRFVHVESVSRKTRESEVVDLGTTFKRRVCRYLGDMP